MAHGDQGSQNWDWKINWVKCYIDEFMKIQKHKKSPNGHVPKMFMRC
jgi:hypothetical protein